jgi:antitoxin ParD1/3/4
MTVRKGIIVSITREQDDPIRSCLQSGRFASTRETVRAGQRPLDRDDAVTPSEKQVERERGGTARA